MESIKLRLTGTTELMLNNPRTVNPFDEYSKLLQPLTSKSKKSDEDLVEISRIKFLASLYTREKAKGGIEYILPSQNIEQSIVEAARERKLGKKFERSFRVFETPTLHFEDEDKTPEELYNLGRYVDIRAVGIKNVKITTTRAIIPMPWHVDIECFYDPTQLNEDTVLQCAEIAGLRYGVGTYRRIYGRYEIKKIK